MAVNRSHVKGGEWLDGVSASVHSIAAEGFVKPRAVGTERLVGIPPTTVHKYEPRETRGLQSHTPCERSDLSEFHSPQVRTSRDSRSAKPLEVGKSRLFGIPTTTDHKYEPRETRDLPSHSPWEQRDWSEFHRPQSTSTTLERLEVYQATRHGNKAFDPLQTPQ
ncbi:hypothetical protein AVEN_91057-1 [Araneus ventricosus]|uniref:Uncharacterized protein n=1 Tax=Araneus ventricosus TaxID=182803 RepID=A0A4Y2KV26_ARAVE|nr:hypothetical protein AVEN_91057-1 [Araneus ventricosus]